MIDKPRGPSSHEVTTYVKKLLGARKTGHAGTLDPQVSGVLIIAINKACKLLRFLAKSKKKYVCVMKIKNPPKDISIVQQELNKFVGKISQIPPKHSAVAKRRRTRKVFSINALEMDGRKILFEVEVEAGTYIRNLCIDAGEAFGGGYMAELRRVSASKFGENDCISLSDLTDATHGPSRSLLVSLIKPCELILTLPALRIRQAAIDAVCRGLPLAVSGVTSVEAEFARGEYVSILDEKGRLIAVGMSSLDSNEITNVGGDAIAANPKIVLIDVGKKA